MLTYARLAGGIALAVWPWEQAIPSWGLDAQSWEQAVRSSEPAIQSLATLLRCKILLWSADAVDGVLARRSHTPPSWIGRHDIWVDSLVTLGTGVALARMGFLPAGFVGAWLAACAVLYAVRPVHTVLLIFMFPLQLTLVALAVVHRLPDVWLFGAWLAVLTCLVWRRLKYVIATFIEGLPGGLRRWVWSWLPAWLRRDPSE